MADQLLRRRVFQSVELSDRGGKTNYVLRGSIDRLQEVDYMGAVRVQVSISVELEDTALRQKIWSDAAASECMVGKSDVKAVVAAMGQASQQTIGRLTKDITKFVQLNRLAAMSSPGNSAR